MTAEQLEELLGKALQIKASETYEEIMKAFPGPPIVEYLCRENAHLTRRALAAEKLVEALEEIMGQDEYDCIRYGKPVIDWGLCGLIAQSAITAYREASK